MRQIGTIPADHDPARFGDYLLTLGIGNSIDESSDGWAVWVENDDQLDRGRAELDTYLANAADSRYDGAAKTAAALREKEQKLQERRRARFIDVRTRFGSQARWNAPLTLGLIAISLIVYAVNFRTKPREEGVYNLLRIQPIETSPDGERYGYEVGLTAIRHGQVWRLITPMFLHFGILHIIFNMFWLRDLGSMIESRRGTFFFAMLVLTAAVIPNLIQYIVSGPNFGGMSGVVYALFGYVWVKGQLDPSSGIGINRESAMIMFVWLGLCMTGWLGPIANTAHVVGLIVGTAFAYVPHAMRRLLR
jgi:GlpG protein